MKKTIQENFDRMRVLAGLIKENEQEPAVNQLGEAEGNEEQVWKDLEFIVKQKWNPHARTASGQQIDEWLKYANKELKGYGVEPIKKEGAYVDKYYYDIVGLYVNMGDTYVKTIVFDTQDREFSIQSWGDFFERLESEDQNQS